MSINYFENFEDLWLELGLKNEFRDTSFYIFKFSRLKDAKKYMPPYRRGFYQIALIQDKGDSSVSINTYNFDNFKQILYFVAPEHTLSWQRSSSIKGFIIYFKSELLGLSDEEIRNKFSFFNIYCKNLVDLDDADMLKFREIFETLLKNQESDIKYFREVIKLQLSILLYKCQEIYESKVLKNFPSSNTISYKFRQCVDNHYLEIKAVEEYAELMNINANYLSQIIKKETGQTAKKIIEKRVILEAKKMLLYTNLTVSEIAYKLGFDEPTHFGRLFKKHLETTPKVFRDINT